MTRAQSTVAALVFVGVLAATGLPARAELRFGYEDAEVAARSELVVIGGIRDGSIQYIPRARQGRQGTWWQHRAQLRITRVLKGTCKQQEIPILIHYGLEPLVNGRVEHEGRLMNVRSPAGAPDGAIQIADRDEWRGYNPAIPDARADNIWLLRRLGGDLDREPDRTADLGILDPEDIQPLRLQEYFLCYMSDDPEAAVRKQITAQPEIAARALRYLAHRRIERILWIPDAAERVEQLLPYYRSGVIWGGTSEARKGIASAGRVAGPYLLGVYQTTPDASLRQEIMHIWGEVRWQGCVDLLVALLEERDRFWAVQRLERGWWNSQTDKDVTRLRRELYSDVYAAVCALGKMDDPRAREALELTRRRWVAVNLEDPQIVEECDRALKRLATAATPASAPASQPVGPARH